MIIIFYDISLECLQKINGNYQLIFYYGEDIMIFQRNDYVIDKILQSVLTREQKVLAEYTGKQFSRTEAKKVWERVVDHKWYVSERLQRDVGLHVAALDFVENFYEPGFKRETNNRNPTFFGRMLRTYFVSKSGQMSA
jgi:hypothetical protein